MLSHSKRAKNEPQSPRRRDQIPQQQYFQEPQVRALESLRKSPSFRRCSSAFTKANWAELGMFSTDSNKTLSKADSRASDSTGHFPSHGMGDPDSKRFKSKEARKNSSPNGLRTTANDSRPEIGQKTAIPAGGMVHADMLSGKHRKRRGVDQQLDDIKYAIPRPEYEQPRKHKKLKHRSVSEMAAVSSRSQSEASLERKRVRKLLFQQLQQRGFQFQEPERRQLERDARNLRPRSRQHTPQQQDALARSRRDQYVSRLRQSVERLYSGVSWRLPSRSTSRNRNSRVPVYQPLLAPGETRIKRTMWNELTPEEVRGRMLTYAYMWADRKKRQKQAKQYRIVNGVLMKRSKSMDSSVDGRTRRPRDSSMYASTESYNAKRKQRRSASESRIDYERQFIEYVDFLNRNSPPSPSSKSPRRKSKQDDLYMTMPEAPSMSSEIKSAEKKEKKQKKKKEKERERQMMEFEHLGKISGKSSKSSSSKEGVDSETNDQTLPEPKQKAKKKKEKVQIFENIVTIPRDKSLPSVVKGPVRFEGDPPNSKGSSKRSKSEKSLEESTQIFDVNRIKEIDDILKKTKAYLETSMSQSSAKSFSMNR